MRVVLSVLLPFVVLPLLRLPALSLFPGLNPAHEKIIEYYLKIAVSHVERGADRKSYVNSMEYFKKAKAIYINILDDKTRWLDKLSEIREVNKKRRAFLEESKVLD